MTTNGEKLLLVAGGMLLGGYLVLEALKPRIQRLEEEINRLRIEQQELERRSYNLQVQNQYEHSQLLQRLQLLQNRIAELEVAKQIEQVRAISK